MDKEIVTPPELAEPRGFNHGFLIEGGKTLYLAGQDATGSDGEIVAPGDLVSQFEQVMSNLAAVVEEAGGTSEDIVKLNVYVADRDEYRDNLSEVGEIFAEYVDDYPAMALFEVSAFYEADALIEMEGFAVLDDEPGRTGDDESTPDGDRSSDRR
ncbi:RidA family protein [Halovivax gelatinilyticus]|uniref:RidA family protein n=1 Tax=Halovivax gelatinilyticus TaxID=2961597 RepID=UPI0020CA4C7F|nr:RidA family protein [Halovivax gelatinilyticus]